MVWRRLPEVRSACEALLNPQPHNRVSGTVSVQLLVPTGRHVSPPANLQELQIDQNCPRKPRASEGRQLTFLQEQPSGNLSTASAKEKRLPRLDSRVFPQSPRAQNQQER